MELTLKRTIPASRDAVFDAWLDPETLSQFMTPGPEMTVPKVEVDGRVGGKFLVVMKSGEKEIPHHGEYREIDRPRRLVFTWLSPFADGDSEVTLTFRESGPQQTEITLTHRGFADEETRSRHEGGWTAIVAKLASVLS